MTTLCAEDPQISKLNGGSLKSEKLTILNEDAYRYLTDCDSIYDVIIVDLPDPNNEALAKLYTNVFYRMCASHLTENGILNVQSTSPYYAPKAFSCIGKTIASEGMDVKPFHMQVPAFGDWGFHMASKAELTQRHSLPEDTKFLTEENLPALFQFGKDELDDTAEINRLTKPVLIQYYNDAVRNWA